VKHKQISNQYFTQDIHNNIKLERIQTYTYKSKQHNPNKLQIKRHKPEIVQKKIQELET